MAEFSIHNFERLLKELEKNVSNINSLLQQVSIVVENSQGTCTAMYATCRNWRRELDQS